VNFSLGALRIRNFKKKDINQNYISWLNNKELFNFSRHKKVKYNYQKSLQYFNNFKKTQGLFFLIIFNEKKVGTLTIKFKQNQSIGNIGILIGDKSMQNKGLATKSITLITNKLNIEKKNFFFEIGTLHKNLKMITVAKKCKFKLYKKNSRYVYFKKKNKK
tara:strand:- start:4436 stop:4918 length:483 start_codon:yes stop_codon:yes gene_type:complete